VDDFLGKPIKEAELFLKIQEHLGVGYLYAADKTRPAAATAPSPAPAVKPEWVAKLPAEMIGWMRHAVQNGDMEQLKGLIRQVAKHDEPLAKALRSLADQYDYDALCRLLSQENPQ